MLGNETITVLHKNDDNSYSTVLLTMCNVQDKRNYSIDNKIVNVIDSTVIYSPVSDMVDIGDYILLGNIEVDLTDFNLSKFLKANETIKVVAVRHQKFFNELEIECV